MRCPAFTVENWRKRFRRKSMQLRFQFEVFVLLTSSVLSLKLDENMRVTSATKVYNLRQGIKTVYWYFVGCCESYRVWVMTFSVSVGYVRCGFCMFICMAWRAVCLNCTFPLWPAAVSVVLNKLSASHQVWVPYLMSAKLTLLTAAWCLRHTAHGTR